MNDNHEDTFGRLIIDVASKITNPQKGDNDSGISSGYKNLDKYIGGFRKGSLSVIAAQPGVGKTDFALSIATNMAFGDAPVPVGFFSFEMSGASIIEKIISNKTQLNYGYLQRGLLSPEEKDLVMKTADSLYKQSDNFILEDTTCLSLEDTTNQIRKMKTGKNVRVIFIDTLDLIEYENSALSRFDRSIAVSKTLKALASELEISIVCICPVRMKKGQQRPPILADLNEMGMVDHFADFVIFLDSPSDFSTLSTEDNEEEYDDINTKRIRVIVAKNREGLSGIFSMSYNYSCLRFTEYEYKFF